VDFRAFRRLATNRAGVKVGNLRRDMAVPNNQHGSSLYHYDTAVKNNKPGSEPSMIRATTLPRRCHLLPPHGMARRLIACPASLRSESREAGYRE
jgi:hypothetical protein